MFISRQNQDTKSLLHKLSLLRSKIKESAKDGACLESQENLIHELEVALQEHGPQEPSSKLYQTILSALPPLTSYIDREFRFRYVNASYEKWFGLEEEECLGKTMSEALGDSIFQSAKPYLEMALAGTEQKFEMESNFKNEKCRYVYVHYIPDRLPDSSVKGVISIVEDITIRKQQAIEISNQQKFYSEILSSMEEGYAIQNRDGKILHFNCAATKILQMTSDQLLGRSSLDAGWRSIQEDGSPLDGMNHPPMITLRTGKSEKNVVMGTVTKEDQLIWLKVSSIPFRMGADGLPLDVLTTFSDVTAQVERNHFLSSIMANSPGVIYQYCLHQDGTATIPFMSTKAVDIYEYTHQEIQNDFKLLSSVHLEEDLSEIEQLLKTSMNTLSLFSWEGRIKTRSGTEKWISVTGIPHRNTDDSVIWDGIILDNTKQKLLEAELSNERTKAVHAMRLSSLGEMSAGIAHEINNPLAIIAGFVPMLPKLANDPIKFDEKLTRINQSIDRISKIVRGLKKFSRTDTERTKEVHSFSFMVRESVVFTEMQARRHAVNLEYNVEEQLYILANEVEIEQVIINLVNNAIDAVKNLAEKWVRVDAYSEAHKIILRITDSGKGIAPSLAAKIFDPFFTTKGVGEGTGLGLSISQGIIHEHEGSIAVLPGTANTCFEVCFPMIKKDNAPRDC